MGFLGIGMGEILFILVIALMIFGPGKLPEIARTLGRFVREFKKHSSALTKDFREEFDKQVKETPNKRAESVRKNEKASSNPKATLTKKEIIPSQDE
jgi:sec-independent protein translocase protein TatA